MYIIYTQSRFWFLQLGVPVQEYGQAVYPYGQGAVGSLGPNFNDTHSAYHGLHLHTRSRWAEFDSTALTEMDGEVIEPAAEVKLVDLCLFQTFVCHLQYSSILVIRFIPIVFSLCNRIRLTSGTMQILKHIQKFLKENTLDRKIHRNHAVLYLAPQLPLLSSHTTQTVY